MSLQYGSTTDEIQVTVLLYTRALRWDYRWVLQAKDKHVRKGADRLKNTLDAFRQSQSTKRTNMSMALRNQVFFVDNDDDLGWLVLSDEVDEFDDVNRRIWRVQVATFPFLKRNREETHVALLEIFRAATARWAAEVATMPKGYAQPEPKECFVNVALPLKSSTDHTSSSRLLEGAARDSGRFPGAGPSQLERGGTVIVPSDWEMARVLEWLSASGLPLHRSISIQLFQRHLDLPRATIQIQSAQESDGNISTPKFLPREHESDRRDSASGGRSVSSVDRRPQLDSHVAYEHEMDTNGDVSAGSVSSNSATGQVNVGQVVTDYTNVPASLSPALSAHDERIGPRLSSTPSAAETLLGPISSGHEAGHGSAHPKGIAAKTDTKPDSSRGVATSQDADGSGQQGDRVGIDDAERWQEIERLARAERANTLRSGGGSSRQDQSGSILESVRRLFGNSTGASVVSIGTRIELSLSVLSSRHSVATLAMWTNLLREIDAYGDVAPAYVCREWVRRRQTLFDMLRHEDPAFVSDEWGVYFAQILLELDGHIRALLARAIEREARAVRR